MLFAVAFDVDHAEHSTRPLEVAQLAASSAKGARVLLVAVVKEEARVADAQRVLSAHTTSQVEAVVVIGDDAGKALVEFAEAFSPHVMVVGTNEKNSLLERMLLGSVSQYVLEHAPCNVLVSR